MSCEFVGALKICKATEEKNIRISIRGSKEICTGRGRFLFQFTEFNYINSKRTCKLLGGIQMSKYDKLWQYVKSDGRESFMLTQDDIKDILGFSMDHSFLNAKKELLAFGYQVGKISLKEKSVMFNKLSSVN
jgi:hypothetical protein